MQLIPEGLRRMEHLVADLGRLEYSDGPEPESVSVKGCIGLPISRTGCGVNKSVHAPELSRRGELAYICREAGVEVKALSQSVPVLVRDGEQLYIHLVVGGDDAEQVHEALVDAASKLAERQRQECEQLFGRVVAWALHEWECDLHLLGWLPSYMLRVVVQRAVVALFPKIGRLDKDIDKAVRTVVSELRSALGKHSPEWWKTDYIPEVLREVIQVEGVTVPASPEVIEEFEPVAGQRAKVVVHAFKGPICLIEVHDRHPELGGWIDHIADLPDGETSLLDGRGPINWFILMDSLEGRERQFSSRDGAKVKAWYEAEKAKRKALSQ